MTTYDPFDHERDRDHEHDREWKRPPEFLDRTCHFYEIVKIQYPGTHKATVLEAVPIDADYPGAVREMILLNQFNGDRSTIFALRNLPSGLFKATPSISEEEMQELDRQAEQEGLMCWTPDALKHLAETHQSPVVSPVPEDERITRVPERVDRYLIFKEHASENQRLDWITHGISEEEQEVFLEDIDPRYNEARWDQYSDWCLRRNRRGGSLATIRARAELPEIQAQMAGLPEYLRPDDDDNDDEGNEGQGHPVTRYTDASGAPLELSEEAIEEYKTLIGLGEGQEGEEEDWYDDESPVDPMHDYSNMPGPEDAFPLLDDDDDDDDDDEF